MYVTRHYEKDGLKPGAVALYPYQIKIREPRKLVAIILPNAPEIKIAAITLESSTTEQCSGAMQ